MLDYLLKQGHEIVIFISENNDNFLSNQYKSIPLINVLVPRIFCDKNGIDFRATSENEKNKSNFFIPDNFAAMEKVLDIFKGEPDIIFTDYEPTAAQFSYAVDKPLVCFEQQSKFLAYKTPDINNLSRMDEVARLRLFFPKAVKRYSSSFFRIDEEPDPKYLVEIGLPLLANDIMKYADNSINKNNKKVLVYFSPYEPLRQDLIEVFNIFEKLHEYNFSVFCHVNPSINSYKFRNIKINSINRQRFIEEMLDSNCIISTAGHQLLSEAILLGKPSLVIPLNTYEQQYNALKWSNMGFGFCTQYLSLDIIETYLKEVNRFKERISNYKLEVDYTSGISTLLDSINKNFGL